MKEVFKYFFVRFERNILTGLEREGQIILEGSCLAVGADGSGSYGTGGALAATFGYDSYGLPSSTVTGSVQHYSYSFDPVKGNLLSRKNEKNGMQEGFSYDSLDRLTWVSRGSSPFHNTVYDDNGNITSKSDAGTLSYENSNRPFQVTKLVSNNTSYGANQTVSYNSFEKVSSIGEGSYGATFVYDSAGERVKMNVTQNGASILARTYIGSRYIREVQNGVTKEYTFIGGDGYSAPAVIMQQGGVKTRYYLLRDHLGSVTHVVDNSGSVLNEYSFDAWGRQRNVSTWIHYAADTEPALFMGRGYTGHEHLPWFNLVNMNGRLYDPVVGRFLSPDPVVQSPEFSQNFNRYSYCLNNPLKYNDPSGYKKKRPEEDERFDIMEYAHYLNSRVGGSGGSYGRVGFSGASGGGSGPGAYTYNSYTGNYYNSNGVSVPFEVVYNNYIIPNSSAALWYIHQSSTKGHTSEVMADGFKLDGVIYEFANPIPYSSIGKQVGYPDGGNDDNSHWGTGAYISGTIAPIVGPTLEFGIIRDSRSQSYAYLSLGIAVGAEVSGGGGIIVVPYKTFNGQNWFGDGFGSSLNLPGVGFEYSQSMYDTQYRAIKASLGIGLGGSINASYTLAIPIIPDLWNQSWHHF